MPNVLTHRELGESLRERDEQGGLQTRDLERVLLTLETQKRITAALAHRGQRIHSLLHRPYGPETQADTQIPEAAPHDGVLPMTPKPEEDTPVIVDEAGEDSGADAGSEGAGESGDSGGSEQRISIAA